MTVVRFKSSRAIATDGVERAEDGTPKAFRIWKAGRNETDHGVHMFTPQSAELLLSEQTIRGNLYSIDVDHLSLNDNAPPEARKAVGWHRLAVRDSKDGPELWAVDVTWTDAVRAGLTKEPPEWRYFSPAYDVEKKSGSIVGYLNTALTNNPATWAVTALAAATATKGNPMDLKEAVAAAMGDDEEKKEAARAALAAMAEGDGDDAKKAAKLCAALFGGDDGDKPKAEPKKEAKASEGEEPKAEKKAAEAAPEAKASVAASKGEAELLAKLGEQDRRLAELETVRENTTREKILASRPDLSKAQREYLEKQPVERLGDLLSLIPAPPADPAAAARVTATRGVGRAGGEFGSMRASRLPPQEAEALAKKMGREPESRGVHWHPEKPNDLVFPTMSRVHARAILASRVKAAAEQAAKGGVR